MDNIIVVIVLKYYENLSKDKSNKDSGAKGYAPSPLPIEQ